MCQGLLIFRDTQNYKTTPGALCLCCGMEQTTSTSKNFLEEITLCSVWLIHEVSPHRVTSSTSSSRWVNFSNSTLEMNTWLSIFIKNNFLEVHQIHILGSAGSENVGSSWIRMQDVISGNSSLTASSKFYNSVPSAQDQDDSATSGETGDVWSSAF